MTPGPVLSLTHRATSWLDDEPADALAGPASAARMYNYYLGGKDNYAADRDLAERVLLRAPVVSAVVRVNRAFVSRSARLLAEQTGIRQFLDLGCGLPAHENVADVVRQVDPACRVVYADHDPMVVSHARALLAVDGNTGAFEADVREPGALLAHPELRRLIDLDEPVGVLLTSVLHFVTDAEDPPGTVGALLDGLPWGSHVVISHAERTPELESAAELYREADVPFTARSPEEIGEICRGLDPWPAYPANLLLSPTGPSADTGGGTVPRNAVPPIAVPLIGCIGRKPG